MARLLDDGMKAVAGYAEAISAFEARGQGEQFDLLFRNMEDARARAQMARAECEKHLREHGC